MEPMKINIDDFKLDNFISFCETNVEELVEDVIEFKRAIELVDKDYLDVLHYDEDYEGFESSDDFKQSLLDEEYSLLFTIGKTYEGNDKIEMIDSKVYNLSHYANDIYGDKKPIKNIGELRLNVDTFIGILVDFEDDELEISVVNYRHGSGTGMPTISVIEDSGDIEELITDFIEKFKY